MIAKKAVTNKVEAQKQRRVVHRDTIIDAIVNAIGATGIDDQFSSIDVSIREGEAITVLVRKRDGNITFHRERPDGTFYTVNP